MNDKQEAALREYLQAAIVPLIEQVLVKKLGQAMSFAAEELIQPKPASKPCEWQQEDSEHMPDTWRSDCGVLWTFTDGGPVENDMKHCCGCGAKLKERNT